MEVKLLQHTPLEIADIAICKCYGNNPHEDLEKVKARINRVANVAKHSSTVEHLSYSFDIDGISRACLQEVARHRLASYTVKSSRYTLQELKKEVPFDVSNPDIDWVRASKFLVIIGDDYVDYSSVKALENLRSILELGVVNDKAKYCMPEAYKTSLVMTINARALQNFLNLRTDSHALKEIQELARNMFEIIPQDHKFLFEGFVKGEENV